MKLKPCILVGMITTIGILLGLGLGILFGIQIESKSEYINRLDGQTAVQLDKAMDLFVSSPKDMKSEYEWALDRVVRYLLKEQLYEEYQFEKYQRKGGK